MQTTTDDDLEWERWLSLSDAERDAEIRVVENEYAEWWNSLTPTQQHHENVRSCLRSCISMRKFLRVCPGVSFMRERLRSVQKRLMGLRLERTYDGHESGNA